MNTATEEQIRTRLALPWRLALAGSAPPRLGFRRFIRTFIKLISEKRGVVRANDDSWRRIAQHCSRVLCESVDEVKVSTDAIEGFVQDLLLIQGVEAVAFLAHRQQGTPITLLIEVFCPLGEDDSSRAMYQRVTAAEAILLRKLRTVVLALLRFVDTRPEGVDITEATSRKRWSADSASLLLGFAAFERVGLVWPSTATTAT